MVTPTTPSLGPLRGSGRSEPGMGYQKSVNVIGLQWTEYDTSVAVAFE